MFVTLCVKGYACEASREFESAEAGGIVSCESSDRGARNKIQILFRSSAYSLLMSHLFSTMVTSLEYSLHLTCLCNILSYRRHSPSVIIF